MSEVTRYPLSPGEARADRPRRRTADGGLRALFTPKNFMFLLILISGGVFAAGKWVGARDHSDGTISKQIEGVSSQINDLDARTKLEALDRRYVTYDAMHAEINGLKADTEWIKAALVRLESYQRLDKAGK